MTYSTDQPLLERFSFQRSVICLKSPESVTNNKTDEIFLLRSCKFSPLERGSKDFQ